MIIANSFESFEFIKFRQEHPNLIRLFLEKIPQYEQLCNEVAYILEKRLKEQNIEFSTITYRAKSLNSFIEKIIRKNYKDLLSEITDIAGVRIVYLYRDVFSKIEEIILSEFNVIEKVDKIKNQGIEKFGYSAVHYLVRLGRKSSGARYDDLKGLICEIQVRTVLQDAWAIIDHHLVYKQESIIPKFLRRKLNSLAGLFETADDQFNRIRIDHETYLNQIESKIDKKTEFLNQEVNLDTVRTFLKWRFPNREIEGHDGHLSFILEGLDTTRYSKLVNLNDTLLRTETARKAFSEEVPVRYPSGELSLAISFDDESYLKRGWYSPFIDLIDKYKHLVKKVSKRGQVSIARLKNSPNKTV